MRVTLLKLKEPVVSTFCYPFPIYPLPLSSTWFNCRQSAYIVSAFVFFPADVLSLTSVYNCLANLGHVTLLKVKGPVMLPF